MKFMRKNGGFTLVELIVVIAILAILAGVAVPAYSGYIKKANEAADNQLLGAVNTAFAAACIEKGVDINTLTSNKADIDLNDDGTIKMDSIRPAELKDAFASYYAGNTGSAFKVFTALYFNPTTHNFEGDTGMKLSYGGGYIHISKEAAEKIAASAFGTNMGSEVLLDRVDYVSRLAASLTTDDNALGDMIMAPDALNSMMTAMGWTEENFATEMDALTKKRMEKMTGPDYIGYTEDELYALAQKEILANNAVLQAAKTPQGKTEAELLASMKDTSGLKDLVSTDPSSGLSQAAMVYGMYTAYAYSLPEGSTERDNALGAVNDPARLLTSLEDPGFTSYLDTEAAKTDLQGYLSAMDTINNSATNNQDAVSSLLVNGFEDPALKGLLDQMLGQ